MDQSLPTAVTLGPLRQLLWAIVGGSVAINLIAAFFTDAWPPALLATLMTLPLIAFAFAHGSAAYGWRGISVFALICFVVTSSLEHASILTGFPFGRYYYSDGLGPKIFHVPILVAPAYFGMAYVTWRIGQLLLSYSEQHLPGISSFVLPLVASLLLVSWNASYDPLISTVRYGWIWMDGGAYFGVPVTNFLGWFLTSYLFFQIFVIYLMHVNKTAIARKPQSMSYSLQPVVLYGTVPAAIILVALTTTGSESVTDQAGVVWRISDIYAVCAMVSMLTMGTFSILALAKIFRLPAAAEGRRD